MTQSELLLQINEIRSLLEAPSNLSKETVASCRFVASDLADRCYFNAGWHMANPEKELRGTGSTEAIKADLAVLLDLLRSNQKPKRGKGRPAVAEIDREYLQAVALVALLGVENDFHMKKKIVERCLDEGLLQDRARIINGERKTTSTEAHIKKIDRELKKLAKRRAAETKNILNSRPKKSARQKIALN